MLDLAAVETEVAARDRQDMRRALAPLVKPEGAMVVDSTALTLDEVVDLMVQNRGADVLYGS